MRSATHRYKYVFCGTYLAIKDILDQHTKFRGPSGFGASGVCPYDKL